MPDNDLSWPNPAEYGRKGDLSLGTDLLKWYRKEIAEIYFDGKPIGNALLAMDLEWSTAARWAASHRKLLASLGKAVLLAIDHHDFEGAARIFRKAYKRESQSIAAAIGTAARSKLAIKKAAEEYRRAEAIQARRKRNGLSPLSINGLAEHLVNDDEKLRSIRARLARHCDLLEQAGRPSLRTK